MRFSAKSLATSLSTSKLYRVYVSFMQFHRTSLSQLLWELIQGVFPLKTFYWGQPSARDNYTLQIRNLRDKAHEALGDTPVVFGECGVPMDLK